MASIRFAGATLIVALIGWLPIDVAAQNAATVVGNASKAMGVESLGLDHLLGHRAERQLRTEQEHRHTLGADRHHPNHQLHADD